MQKRISNKGIYYFLCLAVIVVYHCLFDTNFGDAASGGFYSTVLVPGSQFYPEGANWIIALWNMSVAHWTWWSGRQVMEIFETIFATIPIIYFLVVDVLVDLLIVYCLEKISPVKNEGLKYLFLGLFLSTYYIGKLGSAGYVCTCIVYGWVGAFDLYVLLNMIRLNQDEKLCWWQNLLCAMALIFGCNQEQSCGMMFMLIISFVASRILDKKKVPVQYWCILAYSVFQLLVIVLCPGNIVRSLEEEALNPEFSGYSVFFKTYLGIWSMLRGWIKSPFTVALVTIICLFFSFAYLRKRKTGGNIVTIVAILFVAVFNLLFWIPDVFVNYGTFGKPESKMLLCIEMLSLVIIFGIMVSCLWSYTIKDKLIFVWAGLAIVASKIVMGFSPTFVTSGERTTFFFTLGIFVLMQFVLEQNEELFESKRFIPTKIFGYTFMISMLIYNIIQLSNGVLS